MALIYTTRRWFPARASTNEGPKNGEVILLFEGWWPFGPTSPQSESKPSFLVALICTTRRWIPARASTKEGAENGEVIHRPTVGS